MPVLGEQRIVNARTRSGFVVDRNTKRFGDDVSSVQTNGNQFVYLRTSRRSGDVIALESYDCIFCQRNGQRGLSDITVVCRNFDHQTAFGHPYHLSDDFAHGRFSRCCSFFDDPDSIGMIVSADQRKIRHFIRRTAQAAQLALEADDLTGLHVIWTVTPGDFNFSWRSKELAASKTHAFFIRGLDAYSVGSACFIFHDQQAARCRLDRSRDGECLLNNKLAVCHIGTECSHQ